MKNEGLGCVFMAVLVLVLGLMAFVPMWLLPAWRAVSAWDWQAVPCTIESISAAGKVNVDFSYEVDGQIYRSKRFDFSIITTSDNQLYEKRAKRHPVGEDTCWVNPNDPSEAVVEFHTGGAWWYLFFALVPLSGLIFLPEALASLFFPKR